MTPPLSPKRMDVTREFVLPSIKILKYGYQTFKKEPFELPEELKISLTCLAPTPDFDP